MLLVDTNILVDVLENDPQWAEWSLIQLRAQSQIHDLLINPVDLYRAFPYFFQSRGAG